MELATIGYIYTGYRSITDCPKNSRFGEQPSQLVLAPEYADGLLDIESASHLIVLYWLDQAVRDRLQAETLRADGVLRGCFAVRTPHRPNPIGFAAVELLRRDGARLTVSSLDCVDGTALLDIKPYIPANDSFPNAHLAWQAALSGNL